MKRYDFVVVGSGIAGLSVALQACRHGKVALVTKRHRDDSNTAWAQGGIACVQSDQDSFDLHVEDTLGAGAGLCHETVVEAIVEEAPAAIDDLVALGVEFDERVSDDGDVELDLGKEGGHTKRRILHSKDTTGREIQSKLLAAVASESDIEMLEHHYAVDLITTAKMGYASENRCVGLYVFDEQTQEVETLRTDRVVLCTGGCGRVYQYTTNPAIATGDGVAMAWRAGAEIANMEFIQFHPTCLYHRDRKSFLVSEVVRGEGGVLVDHKGREFMHEYDERGSLAPRDIVARAIDREIKRTGSPCVFLDITSKPRDFLAERFPNIFNTCLELGIDASVDPIPVVPAAHYQCGGVRTDVNGASSLPGLWAVGEVACTGLHGANRLASNSLLEAAVVARRSVEHMLHSLPPRGTADAWSVPEWISGNVSDVDELVVIYHNWDEIRRLMWDYVSIVRTSKRLRRAATRLQNLNREVQEFYWNFRVSADLLELRNLVDTATLIVDSATRRLESRGLHYTLDYPERDDQNWKRDTILCKL